MRIAIVDNGTRGHHLTFTPRMAVSAVALGHHVELFGSTTGWGNVEVLQRLLPAVPRPAQPSPEGQPPEQPPERPAPAIRFHEFSLPAGRVSAAARQAVRDLHAQITALDVDVLVDLQADDFVWSWPRRLPEGPPHVHVLHQVFALSSGARRVRGYGAFPLWIAQLRRLTAGQGHVVVHTDAAARFLRPWVRSGRVSVHRYPVWLGEPLPEVPPVASTSLMIVGPSRAEKSYANLVAALRVTDGWDRLSVVGASRSSVFELVAPLGDRVTIENEVPYDEYDSILGRGSLVIVPYNRLFAAKRGTSGVVADALRLGLPMVVTAPVADQLPPGYRGAVVAASDAPADLARAVSRALGDLDRLRASASVDGPEFAEQHLSCAGYWQALLADVGLR